MNNTCEIVVIGGGAAGLAASIAAGEALRRHGSNAQVYLLEASDRVGRSILKTGNGRCNFSNATIADDVASCGYRNSAFVESAFSALANLAPYDKDNTSDPVQTFFEQHGLAWRQEAEGRRYPMANKASVVVDVLRAAAAYAGVEEVVDTNVEAIDVHESDNLRFTVRCDDGRLIHARKVILACGGSVPAAWSSLGVDVHAPVPVLGPLTCTKQSQAITRQLDNIRVKCDVALLRGDGSQQQRVAHATGELLFRSYGISGICIFDLSRFAQPGDRVCIDMLRSGSDNPAIVLYKRAQQLAAIFDTVDYACLLRGLVVPRIADEVLKQLKLDAAAPVDEAGVACVAAALSGLTLEVDRVGPAEQCQVQRGGLAVEGFDPHTLQAYALPGFFAAGEALDVDGPCGGYNLHWAWASGMLAGLSAAGAIA